MKNRLRLEDYRERCMGLSLFLCQQMDTAGCNPVLYLPQVCAQTTPTHATIIMWVKVTCIYVSKWRTNLVYSLNQSKMWVFKLCKLLKIRPQSRKNICGAYRSKPYQETRRTMQSYEWPAISFKWRMKTLPLYWSVKTWYQKQWKQWKTQGDQFPVFPLICPLSLQIRWLSNSAHMHTDTKKQLAIIISLSQPVLKTDLMILLRAYDVNLDIYPYISIHIDWNDQWSCDTWLNTPNEWAIWQY